MSPFNQPSRFGVSNVMYRIYNYQIIIGCDNPESCVFDGNAPLFSMFLILSLLSVVSREREREREREMLYEYIIMII